MRRDDRRDRRRRADPRSRARARRRGAARVRGAVRRRRLASSAAPRRRTSAALDALDPEVRAGLKRAAANVRAVAEAGLDDEAEVTLPEGQTIRLREVPVRRAAVYAPGGRHPYPSSVVMGAVTARAAGVDEVVVAAPGHPTILAAAALCGADEVYRMGGAQAIAALAYGTETIRPVDVIVGPGQPVGAGGQAPGLGLRRHRRLRRPERPHDHRVRGRRSRAAQARPPGPGRARRGLARGGGERRRGAARTARGRRDGAGGPRGRAGLRRGAGARAPPARR